MSKLDTVGLCAYCVCKVRDLSGAVGGGRGPRAGGGHLGAGHHRHDIVMLGGRTSEAAPCPLQPCFFAKWDILADISDSQYVMGFPARIFNHFLPIFRIPCHHLMYERDYPIFEKLLF